jgi:putative transposase
MPPGAFKDLKVATSSNMEYVSPRLSLSSVQKHKTCKRYNLPGHAHSLTFNCFRRQPFLSKDRSRHWLLDALQRAQQKHEFDLWAYCIMPEHAHILLWPRREFYDISKVLNSMKQSVAKRVLLFVNAEVPRFLKRMEDRQPSGRICYRFWQRGGGYDRNLFEPKAIYQAIDYIHANPVRRGLCARPEDWPWSSAADYAGTGRGKVPLQREALPIVEEFA